MQQRPQHAGFCAGGPDWPYSEIHGRNHAEVLEFLTSLGHRQASCVSHAGGDYLRTLFMTATFLGREFHDKVHWGRPQGGYRDGSERPVYELGHREYTEKIRAVAAALEDALRRVDQGDLDWSRMDAYLQGVEQHNKEQGDGRQVRVLLCLVEVPPPLILEIPPYLDCPWNFSSLWHSYTQVHIKTMRAVVKRYCLHETACVRAIEVINEPDYNWIPDESRVELAVRPHASPMWKYITELHLPQMPENAQLGQAFLTEGGVHFGYELDRGLIGHVKTPDPVPVTEFPWGPKFDKYVACLADLHEHVAFAAKDESVKNKAPVTVVSGAVTNNNLDYLIRMHRAKPDVFRYVDAIGLHPYHWPAHSMHDMAFVSSKETKGWRNASPRHFAQHYYKRFDFLKEIAALVKMKNSARSHGMAGKSIWLTEFGVPTKKWAHANAALADYINLFIYQRGEKIPDPISAVVWEDKWDKFFEQANVDFLSENRVETVLYYTMRGGGIGESTDEEHSNFTLFDLDCRTTRMEPGTFRRLAGHIAAVTGREPRPDYFRFVRPAGA